MTSLRLMAVACSVAAVALSGCSPLSRALGGRTPTPPVTAASTPTPVVIPPTAPEASPPSSAFRPSPTPAASDVDLTACVVGKWQLRAWLEVVNTSTWDPKATGAITIQAAAADDSDSLGTLSLGRDGKGTQTLDVTLTGDAGTHTYTAAFKGSVTFTYTVAATTLTYAKPSGAFTAELKLDRALVRTATVPPSTNPYELECSATSLALRADNYVYAFARS